jgi:hypothetical protein
MRCIIVNGASLKTDAVCARCHGKIGATYIRNIATRTRYCGYGCYSSAVNEPIVIRDNDVPQKHSLWVLKS